MNGLKTIQKYTHHLLNPANGHLAGLGASDLHQFANGYITVPDVNLMMLTWSIFQGRKRYDAATDTLYDIETSM